MKKMALLTSAVMLSTLVLADEPYVQNIENEPRVMGITASVLAGEIIGAATSAIKSGLQSALKNAIFGSTAPNYVTLSQESLAAIENIVQAGFDTSVHDDMLSKLSSLEEVTKAYNDTLQQNKRPESMVTQLEVRSHDLIQSPAFWNTKPYYTELTIQESLAASLSYAIYADKVHHGENSTAYLEYLGNTLADKLEARGAAAELKISQNVTMTSRQTNQCTILYRTEVASTEESRTICYDYIVTDRFLGKTHYYRFIDYGLVNDSEARNHVYSLRAEYRTILKGASYNEVISKLRTTY